MQIIELILALFPASLQQTNCCADYPQLAANYDASSVVEA